MTMHSSLEEVIPSQLEAQLHFSSPIYTVHKPEFRTSVKQVSMKSLEVSRKERGVSELHPVVMSGQIFDAPEIKSFVNFAGETSWGILKDQGYDMENFTLHFSEMWAQEHHKHSLMEQHIHGMGSQIVGFYFLDVPENSPKALFYDPRIARVSGSLPEANSSELTLASSAVTFEPKPGLFIFTNAWLAHSFTKVASTAPFRFVHFNLFAAPVTQPFVQQEPEVEVV